MRTIILDVDGVLLSWLPGFKEHMKRVGHVVTDDAEPTSWDMSNIFPETSLLTIQKEITQFNRSPSFARLKFVPNALFGVQRLRETYKGAKLVALTAAGMHPMTITKRCYNLVAFDFDEVHVIPLHVEKLFYLKHFFDPGSVFVEDNLKHAIAGAQAGHQVFLLDYPYNQGETIDGITRVSGWLELVQIIENRKAA